MRPITLLSTGPCPSIEAVARRLAGTGLVDAVVLQVPPGGATGAARMGGLPCREVETPHPGGGGAVGARIHGTTTPYLLHVDGDVDISAPCLARLVGAAEATGALLVYGDYVDAVGAHRTPHPLADCQPGSLEDRFDLGPARLWSIGALLDAAQTLPALDDLRWHAWYALRLAGADRHGVVHLPEAIAELRPAERRRSGEQVFDYLTALRDREIEAERVVTAHLDRIGAKVSPPFAAFDASGPYPVEASVVIPVRNRARTVMDAVDSALRQAAGFDFNVIVVDNHSTDGTGELLAGRAATEGRLVHAVPARRDLGIGGCWNEAIFHPACGRYAVQLDSDDLYADADTLARMVAVLREQRCGMAVGSYTLVDDALEVLPPGLIDHREWTPDNGPNNALRVGGLGAPRAFATGLLRRHPFPNASYGEDYAVALRISREYRVGRVFDSVYLCRRWEDNTDADLAPATKARYQTYKDRIRSLEIAARQRRQGR